jgi:CBS domain-containing protein
MTQRTVADVMTTEVAVVGRDTSFKAVLRLLAHRRIAAVPVVDDAGQVLGVVSETDLLRREEYPVSGPSGWLERRRRRRERAKAAGRTAGELMSAPAVTVGPDATLTEAATLMARAGVNRLPVTVDGRLVGIASRGDLLRVFLVPDEQIRDAVVHDVVERVLWAEPNTVHVDVRDGVVTLGGELERRSMVPITVALAHGVEGVVGVVDHLTFGYDDTAATSHSV